ncbi:hypothetical protein KJ068_10930 [bacterium]|nr:hypothetical protein [bacterium]
MPQKWYQKASNQTALISGIFALLAAIATGIFIVFGRAGDTIVDTSDKGVLEKTKGETHIDNQRCAMRIIEFKLNYTVNGKQWSSYFNDTIKASEGDTLLLMNFEMILSTNDSCKASKISAEAHIRKPNIINPDPRDKYDYSDGRFTEGRAVTNVVKSGEFLAVGEDKSWILQPGWDYLVVALLEYAPKHPSGYAFEHLHFRISHK